jgi:hypothetical protein
VEAADAVVDAAGVAAGVVVVEEAADDVVDVSPTWQPDRQAWLSVSPPYLALCLDPLQ